MKKALLTLVIAAGVLQMSCKKKAERIIQGKFELCIDGCISSKTTSGHCGQVSAKFITASQVGEANRLLIQGVLGGRELISIQLHFKGDIKAGDYPLGEANAADPKSGRGSFQTDIRNNKTGFLSRKSQKGNCTITAYNETTGTVSGLFDFSGIYYENGVQSSTSGSFKGTFTDVPIIDLTDPASPKGPCTGAGISGGIDESLWEAVAMSTITFENTTFTSVKVTHNNESKIIKPGETLGYSAKANTTFVANAVTMKPVVNPAGIDVPWNFNTAFPATGNINIKIAVNNTYFYLKVRNKTGKVISRISVNYDIRDLLIDNVIIPSDDKEIGIGYYKAYPSSNVRLEIARTLWSTSLRLPMQSNQAVTVVPPQL